MAPYRKPNKRLGGMNIRICGRKLRTENDLICTFPPHHFPTNVHGTMAISTDGDIIAVVDTIGGQVDSWQLVEAPE